MHVCRFTALSIHTTTTPPPSLILPPIIPRVRQNSFEECKCNLDTHTYKCLHTLLSLICSGLCLSECILMEQLLQSAGSQCQQYDTDQKESSEASIFGHTEKPKAEEAERGVKIGEADKRTGKEGVDRRWGAKKKKKVTFIIRNTL